MEEFDKKVVLIVEDEFINCQILANIISDEFDVLTAEDGESALDIIEKNKDIISLILLDLMLPKISGIDVLAHLQSHKDLNDIPVIVLTSDKEEEVKCLNLGAADFISKPYPNSKIIMARIRRSIELYEDRKTISYTERDALTKLYTKQFFYKYANDWDAHHKEKDMDAIVLGIRSFHIIKERFGTKYSDDLLLQFGIRLKKKAHSISGIACHVEADTFMIYCVHFEDYESFLKEISDEFYVDKEHETIVKLQMGVYQFVDKTIDIDMRFERAKVALNKIRNSVTNNISIFDNKLQDKEMFEEELLEEFPKAIKEKQFVVYFQPKFNIRGETPVLSSAEALVRWQHPKLGFVSPGLFVPLFEEKGLIQELDLYVWEWSAAQIRKWKEKFGIRVPISVNVSRVDLYNPNICDILLNIVKNNGLNNEDLLLEITESACIEEADSVIGKINSLRDVGFKVEIDDFGTGYSSLSMISKIPIDALKIDMIFVRNAFENENNNKLIKIIIDIASFLNVPTIAEGVETAAQVSVLKELGCDIVQGYYFSKPIPAEEFERFIK